MMNNHIRKLWLFIACAPRQFPWSLSRVSLIYSSPLLFFAVSHWTLGKRVKEADIRFWGSSIGFYNTVIATQIFAHCPPMVIFYIPHPIHSFKPESHSHFASKSRIPGFKWRKSHFPKNLLGTLYALHHLLEKAPNLELAPTSNKRPSQRQKKLISAQPRISAHPHPSSFPLPP